RARPRPRPGPPRHAVSPRTTDQAIARLAHSSIARLALGRALAVFIVIVLGRHRVDTGKPAVEIDVRATLGAEWLEGRLDRLAADRAGPHGCFAVDLIHYGKISGYPTKLM